MRLNIRTKLLTLIDFKHRHIYRAMYYVIHSRNYVIHDIVWKIIHSLPRKIKNSLNRAILKLFAIKYVCKNKFIVISKQDLLVLKSLLVKVKFNPFQKINPEYTCQGSAIIRRIIM